MQLLSFWAHLRALLRGGGVAFPLLAQIWQEIGMEVNRHGQHFWQRGPWPVLEGKWMHRRGRSGRHTPQAVLCFAHCASLCCFPAPSQCCCPARTHRAGQAGRDALSLLLETQPHRTLYTLGSENNTDSQTRTARDAKHRWLINQPVHVWLRVHKRARRFTPRKACKLLYSEESENSALPQDMTPTSPANAVSTVSAVQVVDRQLCKK